MSDSLRGKYLIAARHLRDANFYKTVVLMIEHGPDGAMGLVVNRPSSITVAHALSEHFHLPETDDLVYIGGPVEPSSLFVLHNASELDQNERAIGPGLFVGGSEDVFEKVVRSATGGNPDLQFRIFSGCAGWGAEQLEGELSRGDWHVVSAESTPLFCADPYEFWECLLGKIQELQGIFPRCLNDPEQN